MIWPFRSHKPIRVESPGLNSFDIAQDEVKQLISELGRGRDVPDENIREVYFELSTRMASNCDAVACGLLETIGAICAHADHMARELLPSAMQPIYYLGFEDLEGVKAYILSIARTRKLYLSTMTFAGQQCLKRIANDTPLLVESFREMYEKEDNDWRKEDPNVPNTPPILME